MKVSSLSLMLSDLIQDPLYIELFVSSATNLDQKHASEKIKLL